MDVAECIRGWRGYMQSFRKVSKAREGEGETSGKVCEASKGTREALCTPTP